MVAVSATVGVLKEKGLAHTKSPQVGVLAPHSHGIHRCQSNIGPLVIY